jgi:hypothetical protein
MLASGRLSASTVPAYCRSINRPESHRQPCPAAPAVLVSPSPTPIPRRKATRRHLDPTSSNLTPRPNPHRARGTDRAPAPAIFVPWRFSDADRPSVSRARHRRRPKTCTQAVISLHARGPDPQALGSVDNDDGLCPKPAYLQAPRIIAKRAFETEYCASLPGTAILPRQCVGDPSGLATVRGSGTRRCAA